MNGFDPRIFQQAQQQGIAPAQLAGLQYVVNWNLMTVQDAVDFAVGMIQVTSTIQKFTAGIGMQPGGIAGVGGPIDVAVVGVGKT